MSLQPATAKGRCCWLACRLVVFTFISLVCLVLMLVLIFLGHPPLAYHLFNSPPLPRVQNKLWTLTFIYLPILAILQQALQLHRAASVTEDSVSVVSKFTYLHRIMYIWSEALQTYVHAVQKHLHTSKHVNKSANSHTRTQPYIFNI